MTDREEKEKRSNLLAEFCTSSTSVSATTLAKFYPDADVGEVGTKLAEQTIKVWDGDLDTAEEMLVGQAHVLQAIFNTMAIRMQNAEYISQMESYGKLALRAQNQCNRTLKTLLEYKNPKRATFIKQQNNLQINQAEKNSEKEVLANELLEENHDARLDTGKAREASKGYQTVEAVAKVNGAEN